MQILSSILFTSLLHCLHAIKAMYVPLNLTSLLQIYTYMHLIPSSLLPPPLLPPPPTSPPSPPSYPPSFLFPPPSLLPPPSTPTSPPLHLPLSVGAPPCDLVCLSSGNFYSTRGVVTDGTSCRASNGYDKAICVRGSCMVSRRLLKLAWCMVRVSVLCI